jgi:hypothetical protein
MRTLFAGALAATVVGCSCIVSPQASLEACLGAGGSGFACPGRTTVSQTIEPERASFNAGLATPKAKLKIAAKTETPPSARARHKTGVAMNTAKSTTTETNVDPPASTATAAKVEPPASGQPAETLDPVIAKAKTTIAAKLEDPKSAEFGEMKRAMRTNTLGKSVDTICGYVKGKKTSGEGTGNRPFLYLVKDDEAYVVDGPPTSIAATAYRNICN